MRYRTLIADPPWRFKNWGMAEKAERGEQWARRNGRSPYDSMDTEDIAALPVRDVMDRDCTVLLWATWPKLEDAMAVIRGWGLTYKTGLPWLKMHRTACPRVGLGYHTQSVSELLLIATKGNPGVPARGEKPVGVIFNGIGAHSAKPDSQYGIAEGYGGPFLELFARRRRPGWTSIGNELDALDIRESLRLVAADLPLPQMVEVSPSLDFGREEVAS